MTLRRDSSIARTMTASTRPTPTAPDLGNLRAAGWMTGAIFDWTGSYRAAFVNGIAWNLLNLSICVFLLLRVKRLGLRFSRLGVA